MSQGHTSHNDQGLEQGKKGKEVETRCVSIKRAVKAGRTRSSFVGERTDGHAEVGKSTQGMPDATMTPPHRGRRLSVTAGRSHSSGSSRRAKKPWGEKESNPQTQRVERRRPGDGENRETGPGDTVSATGQTAAAAAGNSVRVAEMCRGQSEWDVLPP